MTPGANPAARRRRRTEKRLAALTAGVYALYAVSATPAVKGAVAGFAGSVVMQAVVFPLQCAVVLGALLYAVRRRWLDVPEAGLGWPSTFQMARWFALGAFFSVIHVAASYVLAVLRGQLTAFVARCAWMDTARKELMLEFGSLWPLQALDHGIMSPLTEELLFHALMLPLWLRSLPAWAAVMLSAVVFYLTHVFIYGWPAGVFFLILGAFLAGVFVWTRSMYSTLAVHVGLNFGLVIANYGVIRLAS